MRQGGGSRLVRSPATGPVLVVVLSCLAAAQALRLWQWRPGTPFGLRSDATYVVMEVRDIIDHGWYWSNADLGYPFHQNGALFPDPSLLNTLAIKFLALFSSDPFTVSGIWFLAGFPLAGLSMYWLVRSEGMSRVAGVVAGVLFAVAPGHQTMFGHLWLAAYFVVPIGIWLVLAVARGEALLGRGRTVRTLSLLTLLGVGHIYYAGFTLILLAAVLLIRILVGRRLYPEAGGLAAAAWVGLVAVVPLLVAKAGTRGVTVTGALPATRTPGQSETYAGKIMDLLLPWYGHRVPGLRYLTWAYDLSPLRTAERPALGIVAAVATGGLLVVALRALLVQGRQSDRILRYAALSGVATLFFTVGGLSSFVALFLTPQLRTWSRLWVVIFAVAMLALSHWLSAPWKRGRLGRWAVAATVLAIGVLDQTNPGEAPAYDTLRHMRDDLSAYTSAIQQVAGRDCPVFQLPVTSFPEANPRGDMDGYDQQLPYAAAQRPSLTWSGGAMHGTRDGDWQIAIDSTNPGEMAKDLAAVGYCAVEVDNDGYRNEPFPRPDLAALGDPIAATKDGRFTAYSLAATRASLTATSTPTQVAGRRTEVLAPVVVNLGAYGVEAEGTTATQWVGPSAGISIANLGKASVPVRITLDASSARGRDRRIEVLEGTHVVASADLSGTATSHLSWSVAATPGMTSLRVTVSGDPDVDTEPGVARNAKVRNLTASTTVAGVTVVTTQQAFAR